MTYICVTRHQWVGRYIWSSFHQLCLNILWSRMIFACLHACSKLALFLRFSSVSWGSGFHGVVKWVPLDFTRHLPTWSRQISHWRHNERDGVSNYRRLDYLLNCLFRRGSKKTPKPCVTGFVRGIHRWPVNSPHKGPVTRKMFLFDDVIMSSIKAVLEFREHVCIHGVCVYCFEDFNSR